MAAVGDFLTSTSTFHLSDERPFQKKREQVLRHEFVQDEIFSGATQRCLGFQRYHTKKDRTGEAAKLLAMGRCF